MDSCMKVDEQQKEPLTNAAADHGCSLRPMREWRSWKIQPAFTGLITCIGTSLVVAIVVLAVLSQRNTGFVTIVAPHQANNNSILDKYVFHTGLLWTSLPSLIMTFYNLAWGCIATAAIDRQPFIDLCMKKKVAATRSIALDYRTEIPGWNCIVAFRNSHFLVSGLMSIALPMSVMAAAAAHLFVLRSVMSVNTTNLTLASEFNTSGLTAETDLRRSLDLVLATRIYGASPPPWTDGEYAFPSISLPSSTSALNLTAGIDAKAAYLICTTLDSTKYTTLVKDTSTSTIKRVAVAGTDRGCNISTHVDVQATTPTYVRTFSKLGCGSEVSDRRFGLVSGTYSAASPTLLQNFSVISCIPQYWTIPGQLGLSKGISKKMPVVDSFTRDTTGATQFGSRDMGMGVLFENGLDINIAIDITAEISTTEFGRVVFQDAQRRSATPQDPNVLQDAISEVFTSAFAMLSNTVLFTVLNTDIKPTVSVKMAKTVQRLFVYLPVAALVCVVLMLSIFCMLAVMLYSSTHASILREEPSGLLSYADILLGSSSIKNLVSQVRAHPKYDGRIVQRANKYFQLEKVYCSTESESEDINIVVSDAARK